MECASKTVIGAVRNRDGGDCAAEVIKECRKGIIDTEAVTVIDACLSRRLTEAIDGVSVSKRYNGCVYGVVAVIIARLVLLVLWGPSRRIEWRRQPFRSWAVTPPETVKTRWW